jgi:hypothetical protein
MKLGIAIVGLSILGGIGAVLFMDFFPQDVPTEVDVLGGEVLNEAYSVATIAAAAPAEPELTDWPSYNRTLEGDRYSPLVEISTRNVGGLKVICTYDTGVHTAFESGLVMIDGALIGTTEYDTFSVDPSTCAETWRVKEDFPPSILSVNRGVAYLDGALFRGLWDGSTRSTPLAAKTLGDGSRQRHRWRSHHLHARRIAEGGSGRRFHLAGLANRADQCQSLCAGVGR